MFDATIDTSFACALFESIARRRRTKVNEGELAATPTPKLRDVVQHGVTLQPSPVRGDQSNTSIIYGDRAILKLFRRVEQGISPELEIGRFLTEEKHFPNVPSVLGSIEYRRNGSEPWTLGVMHQLMPQSEAAWQTTLDHLSRYFEKVLARPADQWPTSAGLNDRPLWDLAEQPMNPIAEELAGGFLQMAELLGQRTAELHLALGSGEDDPAFKPEPFSQLYQRSLYQSARKLAVQKLQLLRKRINHLLPSAQPLARTVLDHEQQIFERFHRIIGKKVTAERIRCHGDYHLGQVLYTGKDFVIIDFEGEPARSLSERRMKRSPLQDVAGMLRSIHYAASQGYFKLVATGFGTADKTDQLKQVAAFWYFSVASSFLRAYAAAAGKASFFPQTRPEQNLLLNFFLLEKAVYELGYELNSRPDWVETPLTGILDLLAAKV